MPIPARPPPNPAQEPTLGASLPVWMVVVLAAAALVLFIKWLPHLEYRLKVRRVRQLMREDEERRREIEKHRKPSPDNE